MLAKVAITLVKRFERDQYTPNGVDCWRYCYELPNGHLIPGDRVDHVSFKQAFSRGLFLIDLYRSEEKE